MTRRRSAFLIAAAASLAAVPAVAAAQDPAAPAGTPTTPVTTTPAEPQPEPPAGGVLRLRVQKAYIADGHRLALTGTRWEVKVIQKPYRPGQSVIVRFYRRGKKIKVVRKELRSAGRHGKAVVRFRSGRTGRITVKAVKPGTTVQKRIRSGAVRVDVVRSVGSGARGPLVRALQSKLAGMGFAVPRSGVYDAGTGRAVLAWRKTNGRRRVTSADRATIKSILAGRGGFRVRYRSHGKHVEADLSRQVLALILPGGKIHRVYHMSSGKPSTPTVLGSYRFYMKTPGTNAKGMVHSSYFIRGYAIHGFASVPIYPASHGCLRVPIPNARSIYDWIRIGDRIDVYP